MAAGSNQVASRELGTLFRFGALGRLPDAQLVARFLARDGEGSEAAFAALVRRHGPMVLAACRRLLVDPHAADDAFQAVFLVLVRRAPALMRRDDLAGWLHEVAVRTAREARRRDARRLARETRAAEFRLSETGAGESESPWMPGELRAVLDEELHRLPGRYRMPLVLCDLEGRSRGEAAGLLGVPEGTLSSRLARGRGLLRDRLVRRGVAPGAGVSAALVGRAQASVPAALERAAVATAAAQLAAGKAVGVVPAAVAGLARGVLSTMAFTKIKAGMAAVASVGVVASLALGVAWAAGSPDDDAPKSAKKPKTFQKESKPIQIDGRSVVARGIVVDERGAPVAGVAVEVVAAPSARATGETDADGRFAIPVRWPGYFPDRLPNLWGAVVLARVDDGRRLGYGQYPWKSDAPNRDVGDLRVVLEPSGEVAVRVVDAGGDPVAGATVDALGLHSMISGQTDADGRLALRLPPEAMVDSLIAFKSGLGFDYHDHEQNGQWHPAGDLPMQVLLVLDGARTVRVKAFDSDGEPLAGAKVFPWYIQKPGENEDANLSGSRFVFAETGADGVATFDWIPTDTTVPITFWVYAEGHYAPDRTVLELDVPGEPTLTSAQLRKGAIRGRVTRPDGAPAMGIEVHAWGEGGGFDNTSQLEALTAADGTYEIAADPTQAYIVAVADDEWAAPSHVGVVVQEGWEVDGIDFRLGPGAVIRGRVVMGSEGKPVEGGGVLLVQDGGEIPAELKREDDKFYHGLRYSRWAYTDAEGRYEIRVGPGTYTLQGPARTEPQEVEAVEGETHVVDFHMDRPARGPITGRVVRADDPTKGIAGVRVRGVPSERYGRGDFTATADAEGRFATERPLHRMEVHAETPDRALGGIVTISADDAEVVIPIAPTATAVGIAREESGELLVNHKFLFGTRVYDGDPPDASFSTQFGPPVTTDAEGRFTAPGMVIGRTYDLAFHSEVGRYNILTQITPVEPGTIELGELKLGDYQPPPTPLTAEAMSSFEEDAPDAGDPAPAMSGTYLDGAPFALEDFRGQYVLVDFWATWCGPCIAEIPHLEEVHDAFGDDERFAMLSLSVDESIDAPRAFQEDRKLPWRQGFVGEGVHGSVPERFGVRAIPALVLIGPDGTIVARGMRGEEIRSTVAKALDGR